MTAGLIAKTSRLGTYDEASFRRLGKIGTCWLVDFASRSEEPERVYRRFQVFQLQLLGGRPSPNQARTRSAGLADSAAGGNTLLGKGCFALRIFCRDVIVQKA